MNAKNPRNLLVALIAFAMILSACGSPAQEPVATATPAQTQVVEVTKVIETTKVVEVPATPVSATHDCGDGSSSFEIAPGDTVLVKAGCTVSGDVKVKATLLGSYKIHHDNDADTGAVTLMTVDGYVTAPWGASVNTDSVGTWKQNMLQSGCDGKCDRVTVYNWR